MADVLHVKGEVLVSEQESVPELWIIDGKISFSPPTSGDVETITGYVLPGFVDAHCHVGIVEDGEPDLVRGRALALEDVAVGVTVIREPGSDLDTSPLDGQPGLPRFVRMGRHIALVKRYTRGLGEQLEDLGLHVGLDHRARAHLRGMVGRALDRGRCSGARVDGVL